MSQYLKDILSSGRRILDDTKGLPHKEAKPPKPSSLSNPPETDPHKVFIKRTIQERPKKADVVDEFKKFIKQAEECL